MEEFPDLEPMRRIAAEVAAEWELELGEPFALSRYSYVAPAGDGVVLKVAWHGDDESLHEAQSLELWDGNGAVRLLRSDPARRALLEERAVPGDDISGLPEELALGDRGRRRTAPLATGGRAVSVDRRPRPTLDRQRRAARGRRERADPARRASCYAELDVGRETLIHGDFHHHNILRHGDRFVAIDSKAMLGDPEYDVPSFLRNPLSFRMVDRDVIERRIARVRRGRARRLQDPRVDGDPPLVSRGRPGRGRARAQPALTPVDEA